MVIDAGRKRRGEIGQTDFIPNPDLSPEKNALALQFVNAGRRARGLPLYGKRAEEPEEQPEAEESDEDARDKPSKPKKKAKPGDGDQTPDDEIDDDRKDRPNAGDDAPGPTKGTAAKTLPPRLTGLNSRRKELSAPVKRGEASYD